MDHAEEVKRFYIEHLPGAKMEGTMLKAPCPLCLRRGLEGTGHMVVVLNPESFFLGYFRCLSGCTPGGFPLHFGRVMGIDPKKVPGFDPDREPYVRDMVLPTANLNSDIKKFASFMEEGLYNYFQEFGVSEKVVEEMGIGYNGRYLVYPYFLEDGNCYAARCVLPSREVDTFWHGNEAFSQGEFRIFNMQDIDRCEGGALFITEGENNLLTLKELGYLGIAVPTASDLEFLTREQLAYVDAIFLVINNVPEAAISARYLATRLGFKVRILKWPSHAERGYSLRQLSFDKGKGFGQAVSSMITASSSFSPFSSPDREERQFVEVLERDRGKDLLGFSTGFPKMDLALEGVRGINIMGGPPKAGKSCFFMQLSTEMASMKTPVIYYDFENGRNKIYTRTLCRLSRLSQREMRQENPEKDAASRLEKAYSKFREMLRFFRVVTDRKLSPDIMRRQIDFLQHETRTDETLVVLDSLHKLPFKDLTERRTGIDAWLRNLEAIRDEQNVSFLVVSELSRGEGGHYSDRPDLGSFKESGDIEYSADNAMILMPDWDPLDSITTEDTERKSTLWMVASRENSPGKIAEYVLQYPYWGFEEI
jgi:replicative DNA helicase